MNKKNNILKKNQKSFFFKDYLEINQKIKRERSQVSEDRIYILFFFFISLVFIFSMKILIIASEKPSHISYQNYEVKFNPIRRDIVDRNGNLISRSIIMYNAAIKPNLVVDKKKLLLKLKLTLPEIDISSICSRMDDKKFFYIKKKLNQRDYSKLWLLGEKGIVFEPIQTRVYPHSNLFSHIVGQIDEDNFGISGVENYFDKELINKNKIFEPLKLSIDSNLQHIIHSELKNSMDIFKADGAGALLLDANSGEVLSLVSLPDFDLNKRNNNFENKYMNKITKGVFELGSIFKTFTIALAIDDKLVEPNTVVENIPKKLKCSKYVIRDIKEFPDNMSVEEILVRSSNIGTVMIAKKVGKENYKNFLKKLNITNRIDFELQELGTPHEVKWNKCKLETASYGHGITTTPLQAAASYATLLNGGYLVKPTLIKLKEDKNEISRNIPRIISLDTSKKIEKILRKVVTDPRGTASLANIFGYKVNGKTGTSEYYSDSSKNINTFISSFSPESGKYILLLMMDNPQIAHDLVYNYRGSKVKGTRNESGWNAVYVAGKVIEKIGPILAINKQDFNNENVVKKINH